MPTTEIAVIPVIAGTSIGDPNDHGAAIMKATSSTLHQQPGLQEIHFGTQVESPDNVQMLISKSHYYLPALPRRNLDNQLTNLPKTQTGTPANTTSPSWPRQPTCRSSNASERS